METLCNQKKNLGKQMKSATREEKKPAAEFLERFEGKTLNRDQSINPKEKTKSKEKEPGPVLQRPILQPRSSFHSVQKEQLDTHVSKIYSDSDREIPLKVWCG